MSSALSSASTPPMGYVTFSTDGSRLWGSQSRSPSGPWLHSGETHCRQLLESGQALPVGKIAEGIVERANYMRLRDEAAMAIQAETGCDPREAFHAARTRLADQGILRPANAPDWL